MSGRPIEKPNLPIAEGTTISMKVLDIDKNQFTVVGSCKGADLRSAMIGTLAEQEKQKAAEKAKQAQSRMYTKRRIGHPLFKNGSLDQVTQVLMPAPVGEVIFRPSSKGPGHLTATVKLTAEVCASAPQPGVPACCHPAQGQAASPPARRSEGQRWAFPERHAGPSSSPQVGHMRRQADSANDSANELSAVVPSRCACATFRHRCVGNEASLCDKGGRQPPDGHLGHYFYSTNRVSIK